MRVVCVDSEVPGSGVLEETWFAGLVLMAAKPFP
jgi:hypothetical protein